MFDRLATVVINELLSYLRDPRARVILVAPPLMQLLVFSFAVTLEVRNVDIAILDEDPGALSAEFVERLQASSFVGRLVPVASVEELRDLIDRREVLLGVRFADDFSASVVAGRTGTVQLLLDGRRANAAQIAAGYTGQVAARLDAEIRIRGGRPSQSSAAAVRHWFNPNLIYQWYVVPSLSGVLAMILSLILPALSIARERELGTFDQLLVTPVSPMEIIVGKTLPALLIGSLIAVVMMLAAVFGFRVPFTGSAALLATSLLLFITSVVGIGLAVSSICQTQQQAILGAFMLAVPVVLTSGFATPVENMPVWLQYAAEANPLKHFLIIVQGSFLKALPPVEILANALPMGCIALVTLSAATLFVKGRLQ